MRRLRTYSVLRRARAMTMVEAVMATLIVSLMLVAALNLVGGARLSERILADRGVGQALAEGLLAEILTQPYVDPDDVVDTFGLTSSEKATGDRSLFDDVDDYNGWSATPPEATDGTSLTEYSGWTRSVEVDWVTLNDLESAAGADNGIKRIVVTVKTGDRIVSTLTAYRSSAWHSGREIEE